MERVGLDLDQPFTAQPWEEVEPAMREQARHDDSMRQRLENREWVAPLTNGGLQKEYALPAQVVLDGTELAEFEAELAALLDERRALRQTRRERIVRHLHGKIGR